MLFVDCLFCALMGTAFAVMLGDNWCSGKGCLRIKLCSVTQNDGNFKLSVSVLLSVWCVCVCVMIVTG